ncbi:MAG: 16S rRNA (guanine(966)-N(2))-methyltransferase RsmD [Clostridia bacterium]|nr:16S rRNA (guanine(966)-N(2))-methyltransferase RsmD [Clostridia bacterium]
MRVIGGNFRGLKLTDFSGEEVRPTSDRAKVSLFNILGDMVEGAVVSDLFAGSGALGIECLSRGAKKVYFNDTGKLSQELLKRNLAKIKFPIDAEVTKEDFSLYLSRTREKFDLIFIDPPYGSDFGAEALRMTAKRNLLREAGVAVLERDVPFTGEIPGLKAYDERKYGKAYLTFFARGEAET